MAQIKTKPTDASVEEYIASRANEEQAADCKRLMAMLKKLTKQTAKMWGPSIVATEPIDTPMPAVTPAKCASPASPSAAARSSST